MTSPVELPELPEDGLTGIFDGTVPPGLYRVPSVGPEALLQAQTENWQAAVLDLGGVTDKAGFLEACASGLELPDWFGRNWDALADCLTDLSWWGETSGYLVLTSGWPSFERTAPEAAGSAAEVLAAAVGYWAVREAPLTVLLG